VSCDQTVYKSAVRTRTADPSGCAVYKGWVYDRSLAEIVGTNPAGSTDVSCDCCVLSGTGLCVGLVTRPEQSYRLWCV